MLGARFDVIVCNFSLLGHTSVDRLIQTIPSLLAPNGALIVQTLHPDTVADNDRAGWREGSWQGFSANFTAPAPWYYRQLSDWEALMQASGLMLQSHDATQLPDSGQKTSLLFVATQVAESTGT